MAATEIDKLRKLNRAQPKQSKSQEEQPSGNTTGSGASGEPLPEPAGSSDGAGSSSSGSGSRSATKPTRAVSANPAPSSVATNKSAKRGTGNQSAPDPEHTGTTGSTPSPWWAKGLVALLGIGFLAGAASPFLENNLWKKIK